MKHVYNNRSGNFTGRLLDPKFISRSLLQKNILSYKKEEGPLKNWDPLSDIFTKAEFFNFGHKTGASFFICWTVLTPFAGLQ